MSFDIPVAEKQVIKIASVSAYRNEPPNFIKYEHVSSNYSVYYSPLALSVLEDLSLE